MSRLGPRATTIVRRRKGTTAQTDDPPTGGSEGAVNGGVIDEATERFREEVLPAELAYLKDRREAVGDEAIDADEAARSFRAPASSRAPSCRSGAGRSTTRSR